MRNIFWLSAVSLLWLFSCSPSPDKLFNEGVKALEAGDFEKAVSFLGRSVEADDSQSRAWNAMGVAYFEQQEWDRAIGAFDKAISLDSTSYKPFFNRGNAQLEKKDFRNAVVDYNTASALDPNQTDIYYNRGLALLGMEAYEDALFEFDMALQVNPNQAIVHFNKAKAQLGNNDPLGAMSSLTEVINLDKRNAAAFYLKGVTEMSAIGDRDGGCANLKMALSLGYTAAKEWIDEFCAD
ncbi:MAG: tetratricopeptide repeat protein [Lunatimonas sp.]|uniref:tetratricopeptide repeat protein n=1 Tax=Lunatimonas sp. TaxID=2060141 RepID=UPI00263B4A22|nr:tetratricopeptide repeat protein [Lunatimonas sp.]MCC5939073.1 tetratricopeptide repeat protein [Lunatimonas sp.]